MPVDTFTFSDADKPCTCDTCARYFADDDVCSMDERMVTAINNLGIPFSGHELSVAPEPDTDCPFWVDATVSDRFRLLQFEQSQRLAANA